MACCNSRAEAFLRKHGMFSAQIELSPALDAFEREMDAGLSGDSSSLMMIPAYLSGAAKIRNRTALVLDAGGTNLRAAQVSFDENAVPTVAGFSKIPVPGSKVPLTAEQFYDALAEALVPIADGSDCVGFCFSFPMDILPNREGRVIAVNKEVRVSNIEGSLIGECVNAALARRGIAPKKFVLLNDTVATLLCGMLSPDAGSYDGYIGYILGTGTNACYVEKAAAIKKVPGLTEDMIINMESGCYDGFVQGTFDRALDAASEKVGDHKMEKMISGAYQGDLIYRTICGAVEESLFSEKFAAAFASLSTISMMEISDYCTDPEGNNTLARVAMAGTAEDRDLLYALVDDSFERSTRITAINFAAIARKTDSGKSAEHPLCVAAEGTTFFKAPLFRPKLERYLQDWVRDGLNRHISIVKAEDATLYGSAVAALID